MALIPYLPSCHGSHALLTLSCHGSHALLTLSCLVPAAIGASFGVVLVLVLVIAVLLVVRRLRREK